jgi:hypothetical protein
VEFEVQRADPRQIHILLARQLPKKPSWELPWLIHNQQGFVMAPICCCYFF